MKKMDSRRPGIAMFSTHGYVAAKPPLGAADTGGQVVYVLELSKQLAQLGFDVDIWTRRFEDQPEIDLVDRHVRVIRVPCGGNKFIPKEHLYQSLPEWCENALKYIQRHKLAYQFINSHYWDGGVAGQTVADALNIPHVHTPHSLGIWKKQQMETDYPQKIRAIEAEFNFEERIRQESKLYRQCALVIATTPPQLDMIVQGYHVSSHKVYMIPPGYDDKRFFPVSEATREMIRKKLRI